MITRRQDGRFLASLAILAGMAMATPASAAADYVPSLPGKTATVWAVGDGADGGPEGRSVARMIQARNPDKVLYLGDVYETGSAEDFALNYDPLFGRFKEITAPTPGNHEWDARGQGYDPYWASVYGSNPPSYYSFTVGRWQLLSLNSEDGHDATSAQLAWLQAEIAATPQFGTCRVAFWHRPRYSAGFGETPDVQPFWDALAGSARLVLNGHAHNLQRLRPVNGITELVSGAGGDELFNVDDADPRLRFANDRKFGAASLRFDRQEVRTSFVSATGKTLNQDTLQCGRGASATP